MRKNKNTSKMILAVIVAIVATTISFSVFSGMNTQLSNQQKVIEQMQKGDKESGDYNTTYAYAVATKNLKAGEIVSDEDVDFKQFDIKQDNAFEDRSEVINKVLLRDITAGSTYTSSHIAKVSNDDVTLRPGFRALTLPAENFQGKSNKMLVGSNVDIYSATSDSGWKLEDVRIVSFEGGAKPAAATGATSSASSTSDITTASAITFEVSANEIAEFISNASKSKLVLVARNPNERSSARRSRPSYSSYSGYSDYVPPVKPKKIRHSSGSSSMSSSLPNLPSSVPIKSLGGSGYSGLPQPIKPISQSSSVEVIQANVKSKVTFD